MIKVMIGDLFDASETYLCHQCNCVTNRAAHLAKAVFGQFPYADVYTGRVIHDNPGTIRLRGGGNRRQVIALFGQYYPGFSRYPSSLLDGCESRFRYFQECLKCLEELDGSFAFPWRIGCGAAGGNWVKYLTEVKDFSERVEGDVTVYRLEGAK